MYENLYKKIKKSKGEEKMILYKDFEFDMAHKLSDYDGLCKNIHGHTYKLTLGIDIKELNKLDIGIDFKDVKKIYNEYIASQIDHALWLKDDSTNRDIIRVIKAHGLKIITTKFNPTAECMALWIWKQLNQHLQLYTITLFETPTSRITIRRKDYDDLKCLIEE